MNALPLTLTAAAPHFGPPRTEGAPALFTLRGCNPLVLARLREAGWTPDPEPEPTPAADPVNLMPVDDLYARRRVELTATAPAPRIEPAAKGPSGELTLIPASTLYARRAQFAAVSRAQHDGPAELTATTQPTTGPNGELTLSDTTTLYAKRRAQALAARNPE